MSWTTAEFLDLLQHRGIMSADHVDHLREQVAVAGAEIHPVHLARKLVEAGYLNPYFAKTLLEEGYRRGRTTGHAARGSDRAEEDLDLAPLEEEQRARAAAVRAPVDLHIDLAPLSDPDAWPASSDLAQPLPAVNLPRLEGNRSRLKTPDIDSGLPSADLPWLLWALGAAVAVLVLIVLMLLMSR